MQQGLIGRQFGNYRLINVIGRGGFAEVYLGQHIYLNTKAAIKILHTQLGEQDQQAFLTEARTIANLVHPHIIRVLEFGIEQQTPYLVMDYSEAGTLRQRYPRTPYGSTRAPLIECVPIVTQVAAGLQYAHEQKIIHRDIKPENMLVGRREEIQLSDFGIAIVKHTSRYQSRSMPDIGGTIAYMAPEQLQGKPSLMSDQYALAIVVYEWLSGALPFNGSFAEIGSQHLFTAPPSLLPQVPELPLAVEQVIMTALAKDPAQRFPSVQAFAYNLEQAVTNQEFIPTYRNPSVHRGPGLPASVDNAATGGLSARETLLPVMPSNTQLPTEAVTASPYRTQPAFVNALPPLPHTFQTPGTIPDANALPLQRQKRRRIPYILISVALIGLLVIVSAGVGVFRLLNNASTNSTTGGNPTVTRGGVTSPTSVGSTPTAIPSPTPVAAGTVLYQADWSRDIGNWRGSPEWKAFQNGQIGSDGSAQNSFILWAPVQLPTNNYAVEARIQYVRASYPNGGGESTYSVNNYEFGIMVRGDGGSNGYEVGMSEIQNAILLNGMLSHPDGALVNLVQSDNPFLGGLTQTQGVLGSKDSQIDNSWHIYRVEVSGNSIKFFLDGVLLVSLTDNTYISGVSVGLRSVYATTNVSSFKVTAL